jgi:ABC-2 type transport system permease protein
MNGPSLLKKELLWSRHRAVMLVIILVVLPLFFAYTTVVFQHVVPKDSPIAIVPADDSVTEDELSIIKGGAAFFSDPAIYEDPEAAERALSRESVYAVVEVPPGITDENTTNATFHLSVDGSIVPFGEPSKAIRGVMGLYLNRNLPADITVERRVVGVEHTLSEYLVPVFLMALGMLFAFAYLPYTLARERDVLERLLVESSLDAVVLTKIGYTTALMLVPLVAFQAASVYLGYSVDLLAPGALLVFLLTFVYLSAIAVSVMILTKFGTLGRFCNIAIMFAAMTFSSLIYPVGFFSPLRKEIARLIPLHHSMIVFRSLSLKDVSVGLFADWLVGLAGFTLLTGVVLKLSIEHYERTV